MRIPPEIHTRHLLFFLLSLLLLLLLLLFSLLLLLLLLLLLYPLAKACARSHTELFTQP